MGIFKKVWHVSRSEAQEEVGPGIEETVLRRNAPYMSAYRISNGYVLSMNNSGNDATMISNNKLVYCKDHKEIADQLVAHEARKQMNVPEQMQLDFGTSAITTKTVTHY